MRPSENPRIWVGGGIFVALLILVAGWLLFVGPQFATAAATQDEADQTVVSNTALRSKVTQLRSKDAHKAQLRASLATALTRLPTTNEVNTFADQLRRQATASRVVITSMALNTVTPVTPPTAAAPTAGASTTAAAASPAAATGTGAAGTKVFAVQWTLTTSGALAGQRAFLSAVQNSGPRAAVVSSTALTTDQGGAASIVRGSEMTTVLTVFVTPQTAAEAKTLNALLGH